MPRHARKPEESPRYGEQTSPEMLRLALHNLLHKYSDGTTPGISSDLVMHLTDWEERYAKRRSVVCEEILRETAS